ncbi:ATP binding protein [Aureococcus anophagefferens]|uniref:ATP binding protein n=1 Tax=Aureococcus anophagefferens TaxID=44056 RepID=A0ABR1G7J8_AURAN
MGASSGAGRAVEIPIAAPRAGPPPPASAADLAAAAAEVPPSGLAAFAVEVPKTSWAGAGGQAEAKRALQQAVIWPVTRRAEFDRFGIRACRGVLLHGPPGCSKTLLARAASESSCGVHRAVGADVYSPYLGEAEATVRRAFAAADAATPCILFFDEIDALRPNRDDVEVVDWRANLARRLADPATSLPPTPEEAKLTDPRPPAAPLGPDPGAADPAR